MHSLRIRSLVHCSCCSDSDTSAPTSAATLRSAALEMRDGDKKNYMGKGALSHPFIR